MGTQHFDFRSPIDRPDLRDLLLASVRQPKLVYPFYLASRAKKGLLAAKDTDAEKIIETVGDIQSLGNSRYAIPVTDTAGTKYRITIEVVDEPDASANIVSLADGG